ncbi:MAG: hypothetical protein ACI9WC_003014 [Arenicella sp.]|jgi:hypothetical protein
MISTKELSAFKERNGIEMGVTDSPIGSIWIVTAGTWSIACPFDCMAISELLLAANGVS